jgi:hypothetical protein
MGGIQTQKHYPSASREELKLISLVESEVSLRLGYCGLLTCKASK